MKSACDPHQMHTHTTTGSLPLTITLMCCPGLQLQLLGELPNLAWPWPVPRGLFWAGQLLPQGLVWSSGSHTGYTQLSLHSQPQHSAGTW